MPLVRGQSQQGNSTMYSSTVVHCVQSLYINRYVVINQCCLNYCPAYCSSIVVTPRFRLYLLYYSLYSFSFTHPGYTQCQWLSLSPTFCVHRQVCSVNSKRYNFLHFFFTQVSLRNLQLNNQILLVEQFGKSKRQSYFELLQLPMEMQGLKPSILMRKFKQHLPHGISPDNDLFLSMFLTRIPPSMQEAVGL